MQGVKMSKTITFFIITWAWLLGAGIGNLAAAENGEPSRHVIAFDKEIFDAGQVLEGKEFSHFFTIYSKGTAPLSINKVRSLQGTVISGYDKTISPGCAGKVAIKVKTMGKEGRITGGAVVYSNDPDTPRKRLEVNIRVIPLISVKPNRVFFDGFPEEDMHKEIIIRTNKKHPLTLELAEETVSSKVTWELITLEEKRAFKLTVLNRVKKPETYRGRLIFRTNYPEKPFLVVPVFGRILEDLQVVPESVDFGRIQRDGFVKNEKKVNGKEVIAQSKNSGTGKQSPHRDVFVRLNRGDRFKVTRVEIDENLFQAAVIEVKPDKICRIKITPRLEKMEKGKIEKILTIYTDQKKYPLIKVPVEIEVR